MSPPSKPLEHLSYYQAELQCESGAQPKITETYITKGAYQKPGEAARNAKMRSLRIRRQRDEGRKKNEDKKEARGSDDIAAHEAGMVAHLEQQAIAAALAARATTEGAIAGGRAITGEIQGEGTTPMRD